MLEDLQNQPSDLSWIATMNCNVGMAMHNKSEIRQTQKIVAAAWPIALQQAS